MEMSTIAAAATVVCPGCRTPQSAPSDADLSVTACPQCQANLIVVTSQGRPSESGRPAAPQPRASSPRPVAPSVARSSVIAVAIFCLLSYAGFGSLLYAASYGIRQLPPYQISESFVRQHPVIVQALGQPLDFGWFPTAQLRGRGRHGAAYVELSVNGPRGTGRVAVFLDGDRSDWHVREARYQIEGGDVKPLWVRFPADHELLDRLEATMAALDQATNERDVDAMMRHLAPDATVRFILELPAGREVRTFRNRDEYRRETLASILMVPQLRWVRQHTDFRLAPDGRTATGIIEATQEIVADGRAETYVVQESITYSFQGGTPLITSIDGVQQIRRVSP